MLRITQDSSCCMRRICQAAMLCFHRRARPGVHHDFVAMGCWMAARCSVITSCGRSCATTKLPNVTLQVAPFASGPHPGTYGPFVLFRFAMPELPDMVYSEYLTGAVYLDARTEVATHLEVMDRMAAQAATAHRTKEILRDLRKEL